MTIFVIYLLLFQRKEKLKVLEISLYKSKTESLQLLDTIEKMTKENMEVITKSLNHKEKDNDKY